MSLPKAMPAADVLEREFLELRAKVLELAASLDRLGRGAGNVDSDPRMLAIRQGLEILDGSEDDRAEKVQLLFSRVYSANWRDELGVTTAVDND